MRVLALLVALVATPVSVADTGQPSAHVTRIGKQVIMPRSHVKIRRQFTPDSTPTPAYVVHTIIPVEAARWGVSQGWLYGRIACETGNTFRYYAHNPSGASGLGQFMPSTWMRALRSWSREVRFTTTRSELVRRRAVLLYSDGSRKVVRGRLMRRQVLEVHHGLLPRWPSAYNGWASVRAVARAMAGIGAVRASEWSCQ